ncbi:signal peptidase II [Candidatus Falkowbacteria bacterium]|nr:signal peptidase II [Candidatus Falkowbacteria bacterium]
MRRAALLSGLIVLFAVDIIAKQIALRHLGSQGFFIAFGKFNFGFLPVINDRIAFNIPLPTIVILIVLFVVIAGLVVCLVKCPKRFRIFLWLILLGAASNFGDRIFFGGVVDFISVNFGNFNWPTFNLADCYIAVGVVCALEKYVCCAVRTPNAA